MKKLFVILWLLQVAVYGQSTKPGDWLVYHVATSNVPTNNNVAEALFLQTGPSVGTDIPGVIFGDPQYLFPVSPYPALLRKCASLSDANNPGECWATIEQSVAWSKVNGVAGMESWSKKVDISDTVPSGWLMTEYAARSAIDVIESYVATKLNKSDTASMLGHYRKKSVKIHYDTDVDNKPTLFSGAYTDLTGKPTLFNGVYSSLTSIPTTFQPSAHTHPPSDIISAPWLTSEVDGSTTNEIEIASQSGQSGKYLTTNGSTTSWATPSTSVTVGTPSIGNSITSGTAFQPRSGGPCQILVNTNVSGLVGVGSTVLIQMASTSGGTYSTVATDAVSITVLTLGDKASGLIPVPAGWWVKVTYTAVGLATVSGNYTRWDF